MDIGTRDKYVPLRTRIYLRVEYGREPTEAEVEDTCQPKFMVGNCTYNETSGEFFELVG